MKSLLLIGMLFIANCSQAAVSSDSTKAQLVDQLMTVMKINESISRESLLKSSMAALDSSGAKPDVKQKAKTYFKEVFTEQRVEKLKLNITEIYEASYSLEDLAAMIAFYSSPAGQRVVEKQELVATNTAQVMGNFMREIQKDLANKTKK